MLIFFFFLSIKNLPNKLEGGGGGGEMGREVGARNNELFVQGEMGKGVIGKGKMGKGGSGCPSLVVVCIQSR